MGDGKAHAKLSASGAHRWMRCPGSVKMEEGIERPTSKYAEEGTAAHAFAERCLLENYDADQLIGETFEGYEATLEMAGFVQEYLDYVRAIEGHLVVEQRVDFSEWAKGGFGTADAIILNDDTAHVVDLKYGKGVQVDADDNYQAMLYGLGVINGYSSLFDIKHLVLTIVQPRLDHISERKISVEDLLTWGNRVYEAAEVALSDNADLVPGDAQCRWCAAKDRCPALAKQNLQLINNDFASFDEPGERKGIETLTPEQISSILKNINGLTKWCKDIEAYGQELLEQGETVPEHKLVIGRSNRQWVDEEAASKALVRKLTKKEAYIEKLISPAQAEKKLGKDSRIIKDHAYKPDGKITIAHESDKRKAITMNIAEGFDDIDVKEAA